MKVLILSCATGEGHNSAAKAVLEYFQQSNIECDMVDTLSLISNNVSQKASDLYLFSTKTKLFKMLYNAGELVSNSNRNKIKSPVYLANKLYCEKLLNHIKNNRYDVVICTHIFPAESLTALQRANVLKVRTVFIMTDYTAIPFIEETELDYYIIPHEHLIEEFVKKGLPRTKLYPFGIPVKQVFYTKQSQMDARKKCKDILGNAISEEKRWFLLMSGSMGFGHVQELVQTSINQYHDSIELLLVCGNNAKLKLSLQKNFNSNSNVHIIGFTEEIPNLMDACDVLFSKPGGLSSTEAAAKGIALIHTSPIPGCETRNALFFHYHGMSYSTTDVNEQLQRALLLCNNEEIKREMYVSQKQNINQNTCRDILNLLKKNFTS